MAMAIPGPFFFVVLLSQGLGASSASERVMRRDAAYAAADVADLAQDRKHPSPTALLTKPPTPRVSGRQGILYLANSHQLSRGRPRCPTMFESLKSLKTHMKKTDWSRTPIYVVTEFGGLDKGDREALQAAAPSKVIVKEVDLVDPYGEQFRPHFFNMSSESYLHMCAFWTRGIFLVDGLPEYVMRMDTDSCITADMPEDPFTLMRQKHYKYMFHSRFAEPPAVIQGLLNFAEKHRPNKAHGMAELVNLFEGHLLAYSTNLEWMHMPSFRQPDVWNYTEEIRKSGGNWLHRWGDAPIRVLQAFEFMRGHIKHFCKFSYAHSAWDPFKACEWDETSLLADGNADPHQSPAFADWLGYLLEWSHVQRTSGRSAVEDLAGAMSFEDFVRSGGSAI